MSSLAQAGRKKTPLGALSLRFLLLFALGFGSLPAFSNEEADKTTIPFMCMLLLSEAQENYSVSFDARAFLADVPASGSNDHLEEARYFVNRLVEDNRKGVVWSKRGTPKTIAEHLFRLAVGTDQKGAEVERIRKERLVMAFDRFYSEYYDPLPFMIPEPMLEGTGVVFPLPSVARVLQIDAQSLGHRGIAGFAPIFSHVLLNLEPLDWEERVAPGGKPLPREVLILLSRDVWPGLMRIAYLIPEPLKRSGDFLRRLTRLSVPAGK